MRRALFALTLALPGCTLLFNAFDGDPPPGPPDSRLPPWDGEGGEKRQIRCEDGRLYMVDWVGFGDGPGHGHGTQVGGCGGECQSASVMCVGQDCPSGQTLCLVPPSTGKACLFAGASCSDTATVDCPQSTACGLVPGATCTCESGAYSCTPRGDIAGVQAALVGKWRGTVRPPTFAEPYEVSLWIYPDGSYWGECVDSASPGECATFYYGGDGPHPWRKIAVLSTSEIEGASAEIGQLTNTSLGRLSALIASSTRLTFTYQASGHCGQPFYFELTRE